MKKSIEPRTLKGFRDFLPSEAKKRQYVINALKEVFELYGFEPLETPTLEYEEILAGKYGEEGDKLMYRFKDLGERNVAMRYDQTVPLARVVAQYANLIPMPFKRYQIQPVWRADNPQRGRFREFVQCDVDIVGSDSLLSDAEVIALAVRSLQRLKFGKFKILINNRQIFSELVKKGLTAEKDLPLVLRSIDKLEKIGREDVLEELGKLGIEKERRNLILETLENMLPSEEFTRLFELLKKLGIDSFFYEFNPTLVRGLDYYTGTIFEIQVEGYTAGSVGGGGRYDNLIGMFAGRQIPAVGFAFGFDRLVEAMDELKLFPKDLETTKVLVTVFNEKLLDKSIEVLNVLRNKGVNTEIYDDPAQKMEKQLKYADQKRIPYVIVIGPDEVENNLVTIRDMKTREQKTISVKELPNEFIKN